MAFALLDCNSFFASCERLFRPELEELPLAVLSAVGGCVISASPELKAMGVKIGEPWFLASRRPGVGSARFVIARHALYADMSARIMAALSRFGHPIEQYSIDEAFIALPGSMGPEDRNSWALAAKDSCLGCGIPVSIGIGATKCQAKLANSWAKPNFGKHLNGVCDWLALPDGEAAARLDGSACHEAWGIGAKTAQKLADRGIETLGQMLAVPPETLRPIGTASLERIARELSGQSLLALAAGGEPPQSVSRSATSEGPMDKRSISASLAGFAHSASAALRAQGLRCSRVEIHIGTHPLSKSGPSRQAEAKAKLAEPSGDLIEISRAVESLLDGIYKPGFAYRKSGVLLSGLEADPGARAPLEEKSCRQPALPLLNASEEPFPQERPSPRESRSAPSGAGSASDKRARLMAAVDAINQKHGGKAIASAAMLPPAGELPQRRTLE